MKELGRKGGKASVRSRLGLDVDADTNLREKARKRLEAQLDSDDERLAQAAARALYSYGPAKPPADPEQEGPWPTEHRGIKIARILEVAVLECEGIVDDELADVVLRRLRGCASCRRPRRSTSTRSLSTETRLPRFATAMSRPGPSEQPERPPDNPEWDDAQRLGAQFIWNYLRERDEDVVNPGLS